MALPGGNAGNVQVSYKLRPTGATDPALSTAIAAAAQAAATPSAVAVDLDYPVGAFDALDALRQELTSGWDRKSPTPWKDVPQGEGITVPFSGGVPAVRIRVKREFSSQAKPFWVQFQDAHRNITDAVMKAGDDLRQDQVILGMLQLFNTIWNREGVFHILAGAGATIPGVIQSFVACREHSEF